MVFCNEVKEERMEAAEAFVGGATGWWWVWLDTPPCMTLAAVVATGLEVMVTREPVAVVTRESVAAAC